MAVDLSGLPFHVHEVEDGELGVYVGGSTDIVSATAIACAMYSTVQEASAKTDRLLVVVDDTGATAAFVGRSPDQQGLPA